MESWKRRLRQFFRRPAVETLIAILIIISVALVLLEAYLPKADGWHPTIVLANELLTWLFAVEVGLRFFASKNPRAFPFKYWYDILAVLPVFRGLRFLRVLRLLRLFRFGLILTRKLTPLSSRFRAFRIEYVILFVSVVVIVSLGATTLHLVEAATGQYESLGQAAWVSLMTVLTGEPIGSTPETMIGRLASVAMVLGGVTFFAVITGTISAFMVDIIEDMDIHDMELDELQDHVIICGWTDTTRRILEEMIEDPRFDNFVVISDQESFTSEPLIQDNREFVFPLQKDFTRLPVLKEAGIERASYAIILADPGEEERSSQDRDARSVLTAMIIEKQATGIHTTVQLLNEDNTASLREIGVEEVIVSEDYVGNLLASATKTKGLVKVLDELLTATRGNQFFRADVPSELVGLPVDEAMSRLKREYDATLIAVYRGENKEVLVNPDRDLELESSDQVLTASSRPLKRGAGR
jgi:voltage-gated potassium channel